MVNYPQQEDMIGWQKNGMQIDAPEGYNVFDYFDTLGDYTGVDCDGIGLLFCLPTESEFAEIYKESGKA